MARLMQLFLLLGAVFLIVGIIDADLVGILVGVGALVLGVVLWFLRRRVRDDHAWGAPVTTGTDDDAGDGGGEGGGDGSGT